MSSSNILGKRANEQREEPQNYENADSFGVRQISEPFDPYSEIERVRKDKKQIKVLLAEFSKKQTWTFADKIRISKEIGMTHQKVSKWNWDHRKKLGLDTKRRTEKAANKKTAAT